MATHVSGLIIELEKRRKELVALSVKQLNSQSKRDQLRSIAEIYFHDIRPAIESDPRQIDRMKEVDLVMQSLVELCHRRGAVGGYLELLRKAKKHLITLDTELVTTTGSSSEPSEVTGPIDRKILITLRALLPSAAVSYEQALIDLASKDRVSWRGPATDLREALRETLDHLAPDRDVEASQGYKHEQNAQRPTMKQKVRYILRSRGISKNIATSSEDAADSIESMIGQFVRSVYNRSSISTHTPTERQEVMRVLDFVRVVMCELLEIER